MIVLIATAGGLAFVPLLQTLGYAFCFVMAVVASLASLDLSTAFVSRVRAAGLPDVPPYRAMLGLLAGAAAVNLALLVAPLLIIVLNGLRVTNCDWLFGFKAYLLLPALSVILGSAAGVLAGVLTGPRRRLSSVMPYALFALGVGYAVWRFYAAPPVFSYNLFGGYFPGNLYDETVDLREPLYWSRLYQLTSLGALLCLAALWLDVPTLTLRRRTRWPRPFRKVMAAAAVLGVSAVWLHQSAGALGFDVDARDIQRFLGGRHVTEHFVIYYPRGGDIERDIHHIAEDHEFRYAQVAEALGVRMKGRITSYYFATARDKYRMMGAGRVNMAKPWRKEIYLQHQPFPHPVIRHEVVHIVAGMFGAPVFRVSAGNFLGLPLVFNPGLIEGIAVAADWPDHYNRSLTPHQSVRAMLELGLAPPVDRVLSTEFLSFSSAQSYTLAGSFVRYLLETHGSAPMRTLYRSGGDFQRAYGKSQREMVTEWRAMIDAIELPPGEAEMMRERFRQPGIFSRPCPHALARQQSAMATSAARGDLDTATALARRVCALAPHEPRHRLMLAELLIRAGHTGEALDLYRAIASDHAAVSSVLRAQALWEQAAVAARAEDWTAVEALLREAGALPIREQDHRYIEAQLLAVVHPGPAAHALRSYFWGADPRWGSDALIQLGRAAAIIAAEPELGLGHYLLGRNLVGRGAPGDVAHALTRSLDLGLPSPRFVREAARLLAESAYMAGDHALVERAAAILLAPQQPTVAQLYGADWLERLHWKRTGTLLLAR